MFAFSLSCLSATFALLHGSFVPRERLAAKGLQPRSQGPLPRSTGTGRKGPLVEGPIELFCPVKKTIKKTLTYQICLLQSK